MDRTIRAILRAETGQYEQGMGRAARATEQVGTAAEGAARKTTQSTQTQTTAARGFSQRLTNHARENRESWQQVGTAMAVVGGATTAVVTAGANAGIQYNSLRQTATQALTAVTGSTEEAAEQMRRLDEYGQNSWLMRDSLIRAQRDMSGFGIETEKVIPYMDALAEGVAAAGGTNQDFEELAQVMGKVESQGKLTAETFNEFGNRGIDAAQMIADAMGTTAEQVRADVTAGALDAGDALDALAEGLVANFEGSSDLVRDTFQGATADVAAAWRDLWAVITTPLVDPEGGGLLTALAGGLADILFMIGDLPDPLLQVVGLVGGLAGAGVAAAGGLALLLPTLTNTWEALGNMSRVGPAVQDFLRKVGPRAGRAAINVGKFAAAVGITAGAMSALSVTSRAQSAGVEELTRSLDDLSESGNDVSTLFSDIELGWMHQPFAGGGVVDDLEDFRYQLSRMGDENLLEGIERTAGNFFNVWDDSLQGQFEKRIGELSTMFAELAQAGDVDTLSEQFGNMSMAIGGTDQEAIELINNMPEFRDALIGIANESGLATDDTTLLRIALGHIGPQADLAAHHVADYEGTLGRLTDAQEEANAEIQEWRDSMTAAIETFPGLIDGYDAVAEANEDGAVSMEQWIEQMQSQAEAVANWQENVLTATGQVRDELPEHLQAAGEAMVDELIAAGDEGAEALATFTNASAEERQRLIEAWMGTGGVIAEDFAYTLEAARAGEIGVSTVEAESVLSAFLASVAIGEEYVTINGVTYPAEHALEQVEQMIGDSEEPVTILGDDVPAQDVLDALMTAIANEEEFVEINGNRVPADQVTGALLAWVSRQEASVNVDANTLVADQNVQAFLDRWDQRTITTYHRLVETGAGSAPAGHPAGAPRALGGPIYGRANGGRIHGPGTTTSDSIAAVGPSGTRYRLSDDEHIVTAYETRMMGGHAGVEAWRSLARQGKLQAALGGTGYATGGRPGGMPASPGVLAAQARTAATTTISLAGMAIAVRVGERQFTGYVEDVADGRIGEHKRLLEAW